MIHSFYINFPRYKIGEFDPTPTLRNYQRIDRSLQISQQ